MLSPSETDIHDFLTFLIPHSVSTVQNALIGALSQWLSVYYPVETARPSRVQAVGEYEGWIKQTIAAGKHQRHTLLPHTPLPYLNADKQIVQSFTQKALTYLYGVPVEDGVRFLAILNGAWILSCPEVIIRNAPEFATSITTAMTEADLIFLMTRQLSLYLY